MTAPLRSNVSALSTLPHGPQVGWPSPSWRGGRRFRTERAHRRPPRSPYLSCPRDSPTETTQDSQPPQRLTEGYVALPGHPFYGRRVQIVQRHGQGARFCCLIASPENPALHYRFPTRWLSPTAPLPATAPVRVPTSIALSLAALDTLTQRMRALCSEEVGDVSCARPARDAAAALGPTPPSGARAPESPAAAPCPAPCERSDR
jgi:hypothetical protein